MKMIRFSKPFFAVNAGGASYPQFEAGKDYPADDPEAIRCVARGIAEEVEVADPQPEPEAAADQAAATEEAAADAKPAKAKK